MCAGSTARSVTRSAFRRHDYNRWPGEVDMPFPVRVSVLPEMYSVVWTDVVSLRPWLAWHIRDQAVKVVPIAGRCAKIDCAILVVLHAFQYTPGVTTSQRRAEQCFGDSGLWLRCHNCGNVPPDGKTAMSIKGNLIRAELIDGPATQ